MTALEELQKKGIQKLVLDLRDNGGGILEESVQIADEFLDGDKMIVYTEGKSMPKQEYKAKRPGLFEKGLVLWWMRGQHLQVRCWRERCRIGIVQQLWVGAVLAKGWCRSSII
jgi:hypothetical protein